MAKTNNYYWWTPEKWREVIGENYTLANGDIPWSKMVNMTHHERRLYIRKLVKDPVISAWLSSYNVSSNSSL